MNSLGVIKPMNYLVLSYANSVGYYANVSVCEISASLQFNKQAPSTINLPGFTNLISIIALVAIGTVLLTRRKRKKIC